MTPGRTGFTIVAASVLALAGLLVLRTPEPVEGRPMLDPCQYDQQCTTTTLRRTFNPAAELSAAGHKVTVEVHAPCEDADRYAIEVTVTQGDVTATGWKQAHCDESEENPYINATTEHGERLHPGDAQACGHALTWNYNHHENTSSTKWCRVIPLFER